MDNNTKLLYAGLKAVRFALVRLIPKSLRAVIVGGKDLKTELYFYCHGEPSEAEKDMINFDIRAEFSDGIDDDDYRFFGTETSLEMHIIRLDEPNPIPKIGCLAYKRYESGEFDKTAYFFPENFQEDMKLLYGKYALNASMYLGIQRILLNRVEENLREVDVAWDDKNIWIYFYYNNYITDLNDSLANDATEELKNFFPEHKLESKILLSDQLDKYASEHDWSAVFSRGNIKKG